MGGAGAHTGLIALTNVKITWNMTGCPIYSTPPKMGFQLNGTVSLMTGNGNIAPFETSPPSSTLQVCVTGGDVVKYSLPISTPPKGGRGRASLAVTATDKGMVRRVRAKQCLGAGRKHRLAFTPWEVVSFLIFSGFGGRKALKSSGEQASSGSFDCAPEPSVRR